MRIQLPLAVLLAISATACTTDSPTPPDVDEVASDLEKESGGFDTADETPTFADEALFASADIEADATVADAMATDPTIVEMERTPTVAARHVVVMWGRMPGDPNATTARDWSGSLQLSRGGMVVKRRIAFEEATDRVLPRTTRDVISFESRTRPHADGLVLTVLDPAPATVDALTLTYVSADNSSTYTFDLSQLENGPIVIDAGDGNRIIAAGGHRNDACENGFLRGRWHALNQHAGHYLGVVMNAEGEPVGHIRGIYGERRNGDSVFFGKFINREGGFMGLLRGTYDNGKFNARWIDRDGDHGVAGGMYIPGPTLRAGGFLGRWAETRCGN